jgi:hypothetical protein
MTFQERPPVVASDKNFNSSGSGSYSRTYLKNANRRFLPGDWVIYSKAKISVHPGPRARQVSPSAKGEGYTYFVDKFWIVVEVKPEGKLLISTRRCKKRLIDVHDPCLRQATMLEKFLFAYRFPPKKIIPIITKAADAPAEKSESEGV